MNTIRLKGVLRNIQESHIINDIEFCKAQLIVPKENGNDDCLNIRFKKFTNPYPEEECITLSGNVRSFSTRLPEGKNKVELYVFTYFDTPPLNSNDEEDINYLNLDGRICKIDELRTTRNGKKNIHFILANNLLVSDGTKKLNSYIPCIAWNTTAEEISKLHVNSFITLEGQLHSREYKKVLPDGNIEIRVAHEVEVTSFKVL